MMFFLDANECLLNSTCHPNATCNNTEGSYVCICDTGYDGDGLRCNGKKTITQNCSTENQSWSLNLSISLKLRCYFLDTNECLENSPCHRNATCNNIEGSYMCMCDTGYNGDGFTCNGKKFETRNSTEKQSWRNESFQYCLIYTALL